MINNVPDALPLMFLAPETDAEPTLVFDSHAALAMALVTRHGVGALTDDWEVPGVYVLLEPSGADGWSAYVGKAADRGLKARVTEHIKGKADWNRALLIARDTTHGFNSAEAGWLEGRLYDLLSAAASGNLRNSVRPDDKTLPAYQRATLEACVLPLSRVLRLLGYDTSTAEQLSTVVTPSKGTKRRFDVTIPQLIASGHLKAPANLISTNGAWPAMAELNIDGTITYSGKIYDNPSKAASAVKGGQANGWEFWAVDLGGKSAALSTYRALYLDEQGKPKSSHP